MMGAQRSSDFMATLALATDPAKVQAHLVKLQKATETFQQAKEEALKAKADAQRAVDEANAQCAEAEHRAGHALAEMQADRDQLDSERVAFTEAKRSQDADLKVAQAKLSGSWNIHQQQTEALQAAQAAHARAVDQHEATVAKVNANHLIKENELAARSGRLSRLEAELRDREAKVASAEANFAQRLQKMQALAAG